MADEIERLLIQWRKQRPEVDFSTMAVSARIRRIHRHLVDIRARAFAMHELEMWEYDVLAALRRSGEPFEMTPGQLIKATHVTSGTMTNRVDHLVRRGLVERRADLSDGRVVQVRLLPHAKEIVDDALVSMLDYERRAMHALTIEEWNQLAELLEKLLISGKTIIDTSDK